MLQNIISRLSALALVVFIVFWGGACSDNSELEAVRPKSVPETAQLVGGIDGWEWLNCNAESARTFKCDIFDQKGELFRTAFLTPCLNIKTKYESKKVGVLSVGESVIYFDKIAFYEYKPSIYSKNKYGEQSDTLSKKYYGLMGVDLDCNPLGLELINN